jgi:hypothetical protein
MSFEISDDEALEVQFTVGKKLQGIKSVLANAEKGMSIRGKDKLLVRLPIMEELIERLNERFPESKKEV